MIGKREMRLKQKDKVMQAASARLKIRQIQFKLCISFHYCQLVRDEEIPHAG
jgi:hypothetical protein